ncbi:MAG: hypothetical protein Q8O61_02935, partial [Nocardioides sp.]|nr:hypothetical protein [Nocardioides sp.]
VRDLVSLGPVDSAELERNVVGSGWFMPGMSALLTPLFVVDPDASVFLIRCYLGVLTTVLLLLAVRSVRRTFGDLYAALLLVFPGLVPMWVLFSFAAWGDLVAGLLIVMLVAHLVAIFRQVRNGAAFSLSEGAWLGLVGIAVVYLRSSAALLVGGMFVIVLAAAVVLLRGRERRQAIAALAAAGAVFLALLAPWSITASHSLGGRVVTTTSVPAALANTFGDYDRFCFGECDPGSTKWFSPLRYSREVARAADVGEVDVQAEMSTYALADMTPQSYARDVVVNFGRYAGNSAGYAALMLPRAEAAKTFWVVYVVTWLMVFAVLLVVLWSLLLATRRSFDSQILSIVLKLGIGSLFVQPFVHLSSARYWPSAAPLFALAIGLFVQVHAERRAAVGVGPGRPPVEHVADTPHPVVVHRGLYWVQLFLAGATVALVVGVLVLAI